MNWALKFYDRDRDILLEPGEAAGGGDEFRKIADADGDGRVTPAGISRRARVHPGALLILRSPTTQANSLCSLSGV